MNSEIEKITRESEKKLREKHYLSMLQAPYKEKVKRSKETVSEFVETLSLEKCYVSTSGGKDSSVLSSLCKQKYPNIKHVMFNTGLEYKATIDIAKKQGAEIIPPSTSWVKSCEKHGYPIVSKNVSRRLHDIGKTPISTCISLFNNTYGIADKWLHLTDKEFVDFGVSEYCCTEFKKKPSKSMKLNPIIGTRTQESDLRKSAWKKSGCNSYNVNYTKGVSRPISLWLDKDVEEYITENKIELSELYTQYEQKRTGCKICPYGSQIDGSRFDLLKKLEPKTYEYFIYNTKLGQILMISDVDIVTDEKYMKAKVKVQDKVKEWHERNKGDDKYTTYKVKLALSYFNKDEVLQALEHLHKKSPIKNYDYIIKTVKEMVVFE